jgi:hypothetical protein
MIKRTLAVWASIVLLVVCLDGRPATDGLSQAPDAFFPLGFMGLSSVGSLPEKLADVAAGGFNVVHTFRSVQEIGEAEDYLSQAEAVGLQVIQNMPSCRAFGSDNPVCDEFGADVWSEAEWGEFISALAIHDNLVAWFLPDEIRDYTAAANLYTWVHIYDPLDRPVFANPGTYRQSTLVLFPAFSDFVWTAAYPEYGGDPRAMVTYAMRQDADACRGTSVRWGAILQFFDSAEFGRSGGYPTAHELRADSYQAIIGGAKGLWYFNYEMGRTLDEDLWEAISTVADEIVGLGGLDEVTLSPEVPQTITKTIVSGPTQSPIVRGEVYDSIQTLQKRHEGIYLFAVNVATDTVRSEFGNLQTRSDTVEVLFEARTIAIENGSFSDSFAPNDVHVYFIPHTRPYVLYLPFLYKAYW